MNGQIKTERKDRRRERVRKEILRAAAEVFTSKGFHEATIQEIARIADFSAGALYNYFENKEALFCDLVADVHENIEQRLVLPNADLPLADLLRHVVGNLFAFAEEYRNHFRLVALLQMGGDLAIGRVAKQAAIAGPKALTQFFQTMMAHASERGELRQLPPVIAETFVAGVVQGFVMRWFHEPDGTKLTDQVEHVVQLILHGIGRAPVTTITVAGTAAVHSTKKHK
jgi:AcrR family transcriptional regulator